MKAFKSLLAAAMVVTCMPLNPKVIEANTAAIDHLGRTGTYSASDHETGTEAAKAFDGKFGQGFRWGTPVYSPLNKGQWVQVKFDTTQTVKNFKITFEDRNSDSALTQTKTNVIKYHIEVKKPGATEFTTVLTKDKDVKRVEEVALAAAVEASEVRLVIDEIKASGWNNCNVEEFEIYGDSNLEQTANKNHMLATNGTDVTTSALEDPVFLAKYINDGEASNGDSNLQDFRRKRWSSANVDKAHPENVWVNAKFAKTTVVQEVVVNFWRDANPKPSIVKSFDIVYKDENGASKTQKVTAKQVSANAGYEDTVTYVFNAPVKMSEMKITNFVLAEGEYPNVSIEEIEVYSNNRNAGSETPAPEGAETTENVNHLLNATVTATNTEGGNNTQDKINNGNRNDRWATQQNKWQNESVTAVLEKVTKIKEVDFYLENRNIDPKPSNIESFTIEFKEADGNIVRKEVKNTAEGSGFKDTIKVVLDQVVYAKEMKVTGFKVKTQAGSWDNLAIREIEVYSNANPKVVNLESIAEGIKGTTIATNVNTLELPKLPSGYVATFNGCDFEQIVDDKLNIHHPLVDKEVRINYDVKEEKTGKIKNSGDVVYTIKGTLTQEANKNAKPVVVPEIQEWHSASNEKLSVNTLTKVVYNDDSLLPIVNEFVRDYKDFTTKVLTVEKGTAAVANAFYFEKTNTLNYLGDEGYTMNIENDKVVVKGSAVTGNMYGMQTILQMYKQDNSGYPIGQMRDYPRYKVRGLLLDVARKPISLEMMKDITRSMRYYKMNDFQAHLSDNLIFLENYGKLENEKEAFKAYEAFRLESSLKNDKGESPTAKDYSLTKKQFKQFILEERALGMNIVPEIDVPAHATSFTKVWPELAVHNKVSPLNANRPLIDHFDLTKPEARAKILEIFRDYTTGADRTFDEQTVVHVGADEFLANYTSYREWLNEFIPQVKENNTIRMWGGLTWIDDKKTEINKNAIDGVQMNLWSCDWADGMQMYNMGYDLINTIDCYGYMVPNGGGGKGMYGDYLNLNDVYNNFEVNRVRVKGGGFNYIPSGDDQTLGGAYAIWSDNIDKHASGLTESDYFTRFFDALPIYAEKTWAATGKEKGSVQDIKNAVSKAGIGPNINPYYQEKKTGKDYEKYDFASLKDTSDNKRDLTNLTNATLNNQMLNLAGGNSFVNTPIEQLGNGNQLSFDIEIKEPYKVGDILFEEDAPYGTHDIRVMHDGKLGFTRELYEYTFDYKLPVDKKVNIKIAVEAQQTKLYVNGEYVSDAVGRFYHNGMEKKTGIAHDTFALPLQRIGSKKQAIKASIDNVTVSEKEVAVDKFNKAKWGITGESETTHDSHEGKLTYAIDGKANTLWHSDWKSANDKVPTVDGQAGTGKGQDGSINADITFDKAYKINQFSFTPRTDGVNGRVTEASLYVKGANDTEWKLVANHAKFANNGSKKTFTFPEQEVKAVRFVAHQSNNGWVCVSEFDVNYVDPAKQAMKIFVLGENGNVEVVGGKTEVAPGTSVTVKASPKEGYVFDGWYNAIKGVTTEKVSSELEYTFTADHNTALVARFVKEVNPQQLTVTIENNDKLNITLNGKNELTNTFVAGTEVSVEASVVDADRYAFKHWEDANGNVLSTSPKYTFTVNADTTLKAVCKKIATSKDALKAAIDEATAIDSNKYTDETVKVLKDALAKGQKVYDDQNASQKEIDAATKAIREAIKGLVEKPGTPLVPIEPGKPVEPKPEVPGEPIKPVEPQKPGQTPETKPDIQKPSDSKPNKDETGTGDVTSMSMLASMVVASGASVVGLLKRRNRK